MITNIERYYQPQTLTIASGATTSDAVTASAFAIFGMELPSTFDGATVTFTVCSTLTGTYQALYDNTGTIVPPMPVVASGSYDLPSALASWPYWKVVANTAQTTTDTVITICKKG